MWPIWSEKNASRDDLITTFHHHHHRSLIRHHQYNRDRTRPKGKSEKESYQWVGGAMLGQKWICDIGKNNLLWWLDLIKGQTCTNSHDMAIIDVLPNKERIRQNKFKCAATKFSLFRSLALSFHTILHTGSYISISISIPSVL